MEKTKIIITLGHLWMKEEEEEERGSLGWPINLRLPDCRAIPPGAAKDY